ncbi:MAG: hypothetical protein H0V82_04590 [Candidatus Protochlamydia sp.]|nr:hypothetical protein [Candidatus Protochlamydia sp.]
MLSLNRLLPDPTSLFQSAGSLGLAAVAGAGYGMAARILYPNSGIYPTHYALWFILGYKIKEIVCICDEQAQIFIGAAIPREDALWLERSLTQKGRLIAWKAIHLKNLLLKPIDRILCYTLNLRPFNEVTSSNVAEASFLEMCRFRMWNVFKTTIFDFVSILSAHRLTQLAGISLPSRTSVPLFLMVQTIAQNILLAPLLYKYLNFCDHVAAELDLESARIASERARWIRNWLPSL